MNRGTYDQRFYDEYKAGSRQSAEVIVPIVMESVNPSRVIDVGCGLGSWLAAFKSHGVDQVLGVDGDYVDRDSLEIPEDRFMAHDLAKPLQITESFDLVVCLEVAEHLPPECADTLVDSLVGLAPAVLFSAGIPFQGGKSHVNEEWPRYWAKKFRGRGYLAADVIRGRVWENESVEYWYAQNTVLYVRQDELPKYPLLAGHTGPTAVPRAMVHPGMYMCMAARWLHAADLRNLWLGPILRALPSLVLKSARYRLGRLWRKKEQRT